MDGKNLNPISNEIQVVSSISSIQLGFLGIVFLDEKILFLRI